MRSPELTKMANFVGADSNSTPVGPHPADRATDKRLGALTTQEEA